MVQYFGGPTRTRTWDQWIHLLPVFLPSADYLIAHGDIKQSRSGDRSYERVFSRFLLLDMPGDVYLDAADLRAGFNLKTPDALHLACARYHSCDALWTNDDRLQEVSSRQLRAPKAPHEAATGLQPSIRQV
jgi:predicted nucleic acid-binding protein